jgi:uncharacterized protein YlxW (UPF0749 family)
MAHTNTDKKQASAEKKAIKALALAEESVQAAQDAVRDSRKKLRKKAAELTEQAKKLAAQHEKAQRRLAKAEKAAAAATSDGEKESAAPASVGSGVDATLLTPPLPSPQPDSPTLIQLRQEAEARGIADYALLSKAALIEALDLGE